MSSLEQGIRILRCFSADQPELRLAEISRRLGISKSNVHRLLGILTAQGLLAREPGSPYYRLGLQLFDLGAAAVSRFDGRPALPAMQELARLTRETILLGVLDAGDVVYVRKLESPYLLRISGTVRAPVHCTATGKVLLAWADAATVERVVARGLPALSEQTITDPAAFRAHLAEVRRLGYAVSDQERETHTRAVGAPIRDASGAVVAALTVAAPAQRLPREQLPALATLVMSAARSVSREVQAAGVPTARARRLRTRPRG